MLNFKDFAGINNVQPSHRLKTRELRVATNVDVGLDNEIRRRKGHTSVSALCHKNLHQAEGYLLATSGGDLVLTDGATQTVLYPSLGASRVWYAPLPKGRTAFSNGLLAGVTDGTPDHTAELTVPTPGGVGSSVDVAGTLEPGVYRYAVTLVRQSDLIEGAPEYSAPVATERGGLLLMGLPREEGYITNVYMTPKDGEAFYLVGTATDGMLAVVSPSEGRLPLRNDRLRPMPHGILLTFWRGRLLAAQGNVLWASVPHRYGLCDVRRDFRQFSAPITLVQAVDDGLYIGTEEELVFLGGDTFDKLSMTQVSPGRVALGSGVSVRGEHLKMGDRVGQGSAMVCIADGILMAGFNGGAISRMTEGRYRTPVTEVWATFRINDGIPQYIAVPR